MNLLVTRKMHGVHWFTEVHAVGIWTWRENWGDRDKVFFEDYHVSVLLLADG